MNLGDPTRSERLDALAAQYALGTLSGRARRRLAAIARRDTAVAGAISAWEYRLCALATGVTPVIPAPRVWTAIRDRLGFADTRDRALRMPWWASLGWWRALATVGFVLAFAFGVTLFAPRTEAPPEQVVVVLAGPDARPTLIATAERGSRFLNVKAVAPVAIAPDRALELWMLPQGQNPRSLGVIPASGVGRVRLPVPAGTALQNIPALAVSLEPAGGSPTGQPTGPVLYTGAVQQIY
jgi:anti-sigma-K factor RskA